MSFRHACVVLAALALPAQAVACVNEFEATDRNGRARTASSEVGATMVGWLRTSPLEGVHPRHITARARKSPGLSSYTSLAVLLIRQGRVDAAIPLLLAIERQWPGHYETAGNLGTALELAGHDRVALRWIRIGMQRNPSSHRGTEWLHARILEAKLAGPVGDGSIAGLDFGEMAAPDMPQDLPIGNLGRPVTIEALDRAFRYQLHERIPLVPAPDAVVANLLQDWATLNLAAGPAENAVALYDLAREYGAADTPSSRDREERARGLVARRSDLSPIAPADCPLC